MKKKVEIKVRSFVNIDGEKKELNSLSDKEREYVVNKLNEQGMNAYYNSI